MDYMYFVYFLVFIVCGGYFYIKRLYGEFERHGIPYVKPTFPYGSTKDFMTEPICTALQKMYNQLKSYDGPFGGMMFFLKHAILVTDLEFIKKVLIKDFAYFDDRGIYYNKEDDPLSAHLFFLNGHDWRKLRSKLSPTFTSGKMKFMYPTMIDVADRFKIELKKRVSKDNGKVFEVRDLLARFTTDIIGTCAFGIECNSLTDETTEFIEMGRKMFDPRHHPLIQMLIDSCPNLSRKLGVKIIRDDVSNFFLNLVGQTVDYREKNNIQRNDFMDLLIRLKNEDQIIDGVNTGRITLNEIAAQSFVFFVGGFETSSTVMSFCLYELALNHELQEQVRTDVKTALARYNGQLTYEAVNDMETIDRVINESMRKYPPLSMLNRCTVKDYYVPEFDYVIKKGTPVMIPVFAMHHDPNLFPDPERFDINRFSDENTKNRAPCSYLPFGDGPRNCIGLRFGMMQARIGLATLISNFDFSICNETITEMKYKPNHFITVPVDGIRLKITNL